MKLVVKREPFTAARFFRRGRPFSKLRGVRPNLKNCLLIADADGCIEVQATDMEVGLRYKLKAESVDQPVSLCACPVR